MRAPVLSASAAGAGVVMASRPKKGTAMPSRSLLVHQHAERLAAAQLREHAPRAALCLPISVSGPLMRALARDPAAT